MLSNNKQNNLNEFNTSTINSLSTDLTKLKNFIRSLKDLITKINNKIPSTNEEQLLSTLNNLNLILLDNIKELGVPFSDLIIKDKEIINYYIYFFINNKSDSIRSILIALIDSFNFKSISINPCGTFIQALQNNDIAIRHLSNNPRNNKTEIEDIFDNLSDIHTKINNCKENSKETEQYQVMLNEMINKISVVKAKKIYPLATMDLLTEKAINIMYDLNNKQNNNININELNKNKINFLNYFYFNYFNNLNKTNNIIFQNNKNNGLSKEEMSKSLKDRSFLYKDEELKEGEDEYIEYKNYTYPFSQEKIDEIKRQYCGFLNSQGGRIYIGINDLKIVKGINLDYKTRDIIRNELVNYSYDFYPKCRLNKINVYFIPIKSMQYNKIIPNLYVINIIILPGEPYYLYSMSNKGGYISAIRQPGQCINLTAEEIYTEIMRRAELLKEKYINENSINMIANNNNENTAEEDIDEDEDENDEENKDEDTENSVKNIYVVKIKNIDKSLKIKDINRFFNGCGNSYQKFPAIDGKSEGYGEMHFSKKAMAKSFIQKYNRISICGKKQINMVLKKRKVINNI